MRSDLWNADKHFDRRQMLSMGEMMIDQIVSKIGGVTVVETQEQMLERYKLSL